MGTLRGFLVTFGPLAKSNFCPWMDYMRVLQEQYSRRSQSAALRNAFSSQTSLRSETHLKTNVLLYVQQKIQESIHPHPARVAHMREALSAIAPALLY